jgi:hypothetical protein
VSVHRKYIPIYIQQNATLHGLFIFGNWFTCFGWYFHPSSGAHTTVSTASGIYQTVTVICRYRGRVGTGLSVLWVAYHPKYIEQFPDIYKLCNVASCWIYIGILLGVHPILHISKIRVNLIGRKDIPCVTLFTLSCHCTNKSSYNITPHLLKNFSYNILLMLISSRNFVPFLADTVN